MTTHPSNEDTGKMVDGKELLVGRLPTFLPSNGENKASILLNCNFPCDGVIIGWDYFRRDLNIPAYPSVWRRIKDNGPYSYELIGYNELPPDEIEHHTVKIDPQERIEVKQGDILGVFYSTYNIHGAIATAVPEMGVDEKELFTTLTAEVYEEDIDVGDIVDLKDRNMCSEKRTFALRAHVLPKS